jgi:tripartite-type tricarboxylate transporter receptor subunit TctC
MTSTRIWTKAAGFAVVASLATAVATPVEAADFYKGKTVKIVVGYSPGGGYDLYARALGTFLGNHIPGKPNVIVQNMTGAGSLRAANYMYNIAPKDGTQMATFTRGVPLLSLTAKDKNLRYDPVKFTWIGSTASYADDAYLLTVRRDKGIKSVRELMGANPKQVTFGATNFGSTGTDVPLVLKETLGINIRLVHGYPGGSAINLAIARNEVHGRAQGLSSLRSMGGDWRKDRIALVQFARGDVRHQDLKDVPTARELATREEDRALIDMLETAFFMARPYAAPPGIPAARTKILRTAFIAAQKDPGYIRHAGKLRLDVSPKTGAEVDKIVARMMAMPPKLVKRYSDILANPKAEPRKVTWIKVSGVVTSTGKKGRFKFKIDGKGKAQKARMRGRYTKVKINGKKAKSKAVKKGMACNIWWEGPKSTPGRVECKK